MQLDIAWEDKRRNFDAVRDLLARAPVSPGDYVLLPEMFDTGFSFNIQTTSDQDCATLGFLTRLADDLRSTVQGGRTIPSSHRCAAGNIMTVVAPGGRILCEYRKVHPFSFGKEHETFAGGDRVETFLVGGLTASPAICYDLRFPELFRLGLLAGAELFGVGACWPKARQHHWRALLIARAIENQAIVLGCNRTGRDPRLEYVGGSIAVGPKGDVLGELGPEPGVLSVEIDPVSVRAWRGAFPAWKDMKLIKIP